MRVPRIYHPTPLSAQQQINLCDSAARHVARVLRLNVGNELILFDGKGGEYPSIITGLDKRNVQVECGMRIDREPESPLVITLAQGISRGDRMDYTIQKAVELGVNRIVPLSTERSVVNLKGDRLEKKMQHWLGIIISACEQCGRNTLPKLTPLYDLKQWIQVETAGSALILDHRASSGISTLKIKDNQCTLLVGPEGGLSEQEREMAIAQGYQGIRLGPRILRTETAALTALAGIQSRWGDLG